MAEQYKKFWHKSLWIAIGVFCIRCLFAKVLFNSAFSAYDLYGYAGETVGFSALLMLLYEKYIWKWKYNPFESMPVLAESYSGYLKSSYDNKERSIKLKIKQSLLSVSVIMETNESDSNSISASIDKIQNVWQLTYTYLNVPNAEVRERSEIHYGTAFLSIENPMLIKGHYYTDRKTTGDIQLKADRKGR